jgi:hypothetical protein
MINLDKCHIYITRCFDVIRTCEVIQDICDISLLKDMTFSFYIEYSVII